MNDRYGTFDLEAFGGNGYQGSAPTTVQQPIQQRYTGRGPSMESYDPARIINPATMAAYNPTISSTTNRQSAGVTHRTMMPAAPLVASPAAINGLQHPQHLRAMADFEPLPISTAAIHRLSQTTQILQQTTKSSPQTNEYDQHRLTASVSVGMGRSAAAVPTVGPISPLNDVFASQSGLVGQQKHSQSSAKSPAKTTPKREIWLQELRLTVSGLSLEPMKGDEVVSRVDQRTKEVMTRYLPCVEFLVQCQQELRKGLAAATTKRLIHHMFRDAMTPRQFYNSYVANLPERFFRKNRGIMNAEDLNAAFKELEKLCSNARAVERQGCEIVKNTFLGGMKDGESWGLRKWLSKHGGALHICNDSECILHACQKLDRSLDSTRKLGEKLRPLAKKALVKLKADVPSSYQEHSTAHPYLPFFHRLEAALKGMSNFDPEDDDVICIDDDDEIEELKAQAPALKKDKSQKVTNQISKSMKRKKMSSTSVEDEASVGGGVHDNDDDSVIEVFQAKAPPKKRKKDPVSLSTKEDDDYMNALLNSLNDEASHSELFGNDDFDNISFEYEKKGALDLAAGIERLAVMFDTNQGSLVRPANIAATAFWDESQIFASALRLFSEILRDPHAMCHLERIDEDEMIQNGNPPYSKVIRHPLCLRDIVRALVEETDDMNQNVTGSNGMLEGRDLNSWNMWRGIELLQAIDLVFLNSLAYGKVLEEGKSMERSKTNKVRKQLWAGIKGVIDSNIASYDQDERRRCTPTRRGESSGFVVYKAK